jgi:hypothetical protein
MTKQKLASFIKTSQKLERERVELNGNKELHDYAGMNPEAAKVMGWPDEHHAIQLDKNQSENTQVKNLVHETIEQEEMKQGESYHDAHVEALRAETTVETPEQLVIKVNQIRKEKTEKPYVIDKLTPSSPKAKVLLKTKYFPKRDEAVKSLHNPKVVEVHDDGDLTVKKNKSLFVITTQGQTFRQVSPAHNYKIPARRVVPMHRTRNGGLTRRSDR